MSSIPSADAKAVVRAAEALTTQVRRIADTLRTPVVEHVAVADDDATTPATTCSARHRRFDDGRDCIRAAHHTGKDHVDERGFHWSDTVAVYPVDPGAVKVAPAPDVPHCVCGNPIEQAGDPADWIHSPGSDTPCTDARPALNRCAHRGPHPGFTCAEVDASQPYFRVRWDQEQQAADDSAPYLVRVLVDRAARGVLSLPDEGEALRRRVEQFITGRETWKAKAEEIERERDQQAAVLREVLGQFADWPKGGTLWPQGGVVARVDTGEWDRWDSVATPTVERPWWEQVAAHEQAAAEATQHVLELKATIESVRAVAEVIEANGIKWAADSVRRALDGAEQVDEPAGQDADVVHPEAEPQVDGAARVEGTVAGLQWRHEPDGTWTVGFADGVLTVPAATSEDRRSYLLFCIATRQQGIISTNSVRDTLHGGHLR